MFFLNDESGQTGEVQVLMGVLILITLAIAAIIGLILYYGYATYLVGGIILLVILIALYMIFKA